MTSRNRISPETQPGGARRFIWLTIAIVAVIALYTAGWYWAANRLEAEASSTVARLRGDLTEADCTNPTARGFPFRIGLYCDALAFSDKRRGISLTATGLRSAAQVYQPSRVVGELDMIGVDIAEPDGERVSLAARDIRFSSRLAEPLPERLSVTAEQLALADPDGAGLAHAETGAAHFRPRQADADIAAQIGKLTSANLPGMPPLDVALDATLFDGIARIRDGIRSARGLKGELRSITLRLPDSALDISGPISVDEDGLVDANLSLKVTNPAAIARHLAVAMPELAHRIERMQGMIGALGSQPVIPVAIDKGNVRITIFSIGRIPPLL